MADSPVRKQVVANAAPVPSSTMAVVAPALGWLIPGAGHLIQKRWIRGLLLMAASVAMFLFGLLMQGRIYKPNGGGILPLPGFLGQYCRPRPFHLLLPPPPSLHLLSPSAP